MKKRVTTWEEAQTTQSHESHTVVTGHLLGRKQDGWSSQLKQKSFSYIVGRS